MYIYIYIYIPTPDFITYYYNIHTLTIIYTDYIMYDNLHKQIHNIMHNSIIIMYIKRLSYTYILDHILYNILYTKYAKLFRSIYILYNTQAHTGRRRIAWRQELGGGDNSKNNSNNNNDNNNSDTNSNKSNNTSNNTTND